MIFTTEKQLEELKDKLSDAHRTTIQGGLDALKEAHKNKNFDEIEAATAALNQAWQAASTEMYQQEAAAGGPGAGPGPESNGHAEPEQEADVTDVEFEEVDDSK